LRAGLYDIRRRSPSVTCSSCFEYLPGAASYTSSAGTPGRYYYDGRRAVACDAVQLARYLRSRVQDAAGQAPPPLQLLQTVSDKGHYRTQQSTLTANPQDRCSVAPILPDSYIIPWAHL